MLTIWLATCTLMMLAALAKCRLLGCDSELGRAGKLAGIHVYGDGDVIAVGWFGRGWHCMSGI
jgi:hypothetical protein